LAILVVVVVSEVVVLEALAMRSFVALVALACRLVADSEVVEVEVTAAMLMLCDIDNE